MVICRLLSFYHKHSTPFGEIKIVRCTIIELERVDCIRVSHCQFKSDSSSTCRSWNRDKQSVCVCASVMRLTLTDGLNEWMGSFIIIHSSPVHGSTACVHEKKKKKQRSRNKRASADLFGRCLPIDSQSKERKMKQKNADATDARHLAAES